MEASATRELVHSYLIASIDLAILALALALSVASLLIVAISMRRLRNAARRLERARAPATPHGELSPAEELRRAVDLGELELLYQPEGSFGSLEVTVVEALLRWRRPDGRYWSPGDFLFDAERSGLISEISEWVMKCAIATAARWRRGCWPEVRMAVNVSPHQLLDRTFVDRVRSLLDEARVPPACLEIELTENVVQTGPATIEALRGLRDLGVSVALDDFGTGYSSLTSLEQLPLTRVKIDRSLVGSVDTSSRSAAIVRSIISLCRSLDLHVTAEGVERPTQLASLLSNSEVQVQGYLLARPLSEADFERFIARSQEHMQELLLRAFEHLHGVRSDIELTGRRERVGERGS